VFFFFGGSPRLLKIQIKFQKKPGFGKEKKSVVEDVATLGPMAQATLLLVSKKKR
jgi:hypothetical protein